MEKIRQFFKNVFSVNSLISGTIGFCIGITIYSLIKYFMQDPFKYINIFITCIGILVIFFFVGYIINNTLFKDDD